MSFPILSPTSSLKNVFFWNYYSEIVFISIASFLYLYYICVYKQYMITVCIFTFYINSIIYLSAICFLFFPFKVMFLRDIKAHVGSHGSFIHFLNFWIVFHCMTISQFIYSPADGHFVCFQYFAIANHSAMNISGHVFLCTCVSFSCCPVLLALFYLCWTEWH